MKKIFTLILVMISATIFAENFNSMDLSTFQVPSFLDMNKVNVSHSISFTSSVSSNGYGSYESVYTNHLNFNFNPKLSLDIDLNFVNFGTATFHKIYDIEGNNDNDSAIIPEFSLKFQPSDNTSIILEVRRGINYQNRWNQRW